MAKPQRRETTTEGVGGSDPPLVYGVNRVIFADPMKKKLGANRRGIIYYIILNSGMR